MKKLVFTFILVSLVGLISNAQVPSTFNYQAIIRNTDGSVRANENIVIQMIIIKDSKTVYAETHNISTNQFGLISLEVGSAETSSFNSIDWSQGGYYLMVDIDGTPLLKSLIKTVPYALHAKTADETDPEFKASQANNITSQHIADLDNLSGINTGDQELSNYVTKAYLDTMLIRAGAYTVKDNDGNIYKTVLIGSQLWMAENLKVTKEANGTAIPLITNGRSWASSSSKAYCYYNNNADGEKNTYGALYNFQAAMTACPTGWHLPSYAEWVELEDYIGDNGYLGSEGTALKSKSGWSALDNGTNNYGFSVLPGGMRQVGVGDFVFEGERGYFLLDSPDYFIRISGDSDVKTITASPSYGMSVRCIKD